MRVTRSLRRLTNLLKLEEEQAQTSLEAALSELRRFERALHSARERERAGRELLRLSISSNKEVDRVAALEEIAAAQRIAAMLRPMVEEAARQVETKRQTVLAKRVERKQSETLAAKAEAREALQSAHRTQQVMDDWYLVRLMQSASSDAE